MPKNESIIAHRVLGDSVTSPVNHPDGISIIGEVTNSFAGNIILRIGHTNRHGWQQTEHVVLTPEEAKSLCERITDLIPAKDFA